MLELVYLIFCCNLFVGIIALPGMEECVTPPLECPNINITFWLYTRANKDKPHQIRAGDSESIKTAPWVADAPVKILIHGYTGFKDFSPNTEIRPAYMECCNYNIISVDYEPIARQPCYIQAAHNTELVGMCTAQLIDDLIENHRFALDQFHPVGFSLGGQTVGFIGNYLKSGRLNRITALDPAFPLFVTPDNNRKVDKSDALFVDVLHTNALWKGKLEPSGHVDFYANGGLTQPGCNATANETKSGCDHARAPAYYAESIISDRGCYARKYSCLLFLGLCSASNPDETILFGEYVPTNASGIYFMSTNSRSPYCRGDDRENDDDDIATRAVLFDNLQLLTEPDVINYLNNIY